MMLRPAPDTPTNNIAPHGAARRAWLLALLAVFLLTLLGCQDTYQAEHIDKDGSRTVFRSKTDPKHSAPSGKMGSGPILPPRDGSSSDTPAPKNTTPAAPGWWLEWTPQFKTPSAAELTSVRAGQAMMLGIGFLAVAVVMFVLRRWMPLLIIPTAAYWAPGWVGVGLIVASFWFPAIPTAVWVGLLVAAAAGVLLSWRANHQDAISAASSTPPPLPSTLSPPPTSLAS